MYQGLYNPATSPAEPGLHWSCTGYPAVTEKAHPLIGFPWLLGEQRARQGQAKRWLSRAGREGAWDLQTCLVAAP